MRVSWWSCAVTGVKIAADGEEMSPEQKAGCLLNQNVSFKKKSDMCSCVSKEDLELFIGTFDESALSNETKLTGNLTN